MTGVSEKGLNKMLELLIKQSEKTNKQIAELTKSVQLLAETSARSEEREKHIAEKVDGFQRSLSRLFNKIDHVTADQISMKKDIESNFKWRNNITKVAGGVLVIVLGAIAMSFINL